MVRPVDDFDFNDLLCPWHFAPPKDGLFLRKEVSSWAFRGSCFVALLEAWTMLATSLKLRAGGGPTLRPTLFKTKHLS